MATKKENNETTPVQPARKPRRTLTAEEKQARDEKKAAAAIKFLAARAAAPAIGELNNAIDALRRGNTQAADGYLVTAAKLVDEMLQKKGA